MKKYSRSAHGRKASKQNSVVAQARSTEDITDATHLLGGNGDQQELEVTDTLKALTISSGEEAHNMEETQICYDRYKCDNMIDGHEGHPSPIAPTVAAQSTSECDSTQHDLTATNSDCAEKMPTCLPLNCVWGNGVRFQTAQELPNPFAQYQMPASLPTAPLSIVQMPNINPHLPFPDGSGSMNPMAPFGIQTTMMQPPAPTLNVSLGYPSVYISPAGLITVLLKYDIAVEMTVDKNIRVVNHRHKAVAATNNRGSTNCVYHVAAKVFQDGTKTEVEVFGERRARMQTNGILFAAGLEVYLLDENHIVPSQFMFNDMSKDSSVNVLFTPGMVFTNELLVQCDEITKNSRYYFHKDGSTTIIINNIKIHQDDQGEVQVTSGRRYISTSPVCGNVFLQTHFVEISVQVNWNVSVQRGTQKVNATYTNFVVCNGDHESGFNQFREVFSRAYNPTVSEFENWLPSLTFLCQGVPQVRKNRMNVYTGKEPRNRGDGDQTSCSYSQ